MNSMYIDISSVKLNQNNQLNLGQRKHSNSSSKQWASWNTIKSIRFQKELLEL